MSGRILIREGLALLWTVIRRAGLARPGPSRFPRVLYYHSVVPPDGPGEVSPDLAVAPATFEAQMRYLAAHFRLLTLDETVRRIDSATPFDPKEVLVTFDDGYRDNYTQAFPVLRTLGVPATIFVTTGYVGSSRPFWWDELAEVLPRLDRDTLAGALARDPTVALTLRAASASLTPTGKARRAVVAAARDATPAERERFLEIVRSIDTAPPDAAKVRRFLSWDEIREMAKEGISFGSHTRSHPFLTQIPAEDAREEISASKADLERNIGRPVLAFAYPDGRFDEAILGLVRQAGYTCAFQTRRLVGEGGQFAIPRRPVKEGHSTGFGGRFSPRLFGAELDGAIEAALFRTGRR